MWPRTPACAACGPAEGLSERLLSFLSSVLESDPEFGFEEAKQQLEGIHVPLSHPLKSSVFTSGVVSGLWYQLGDQCSCCRIGEFQ